MIDNFKLSDAILYAHIRMNMMDILKENVRYELSIKQNFDTACWSYQMNTHTHKIYMGDGALDRTKEDFKDYDRAVLSYMVHEAGHSLYTTKDLGKLSKKLKEEGIDFKLYNLFEDAKIEHKIREDYPFKFNWTLFEDIPEDSPIERPSTTFFKIIQTENTQIFDVPYFEKVKEFYHQTIKTKNDEDLISVIKKWLLDFPNETTPEINKGMDNNNQKDKNSSSTNENQINLEDLSDLEISSLLQTDEDFAEDFENGCTTVIGDMKEELNQLENELNSKKDDNSVKYLTPVVASENEELETSNSTILFTEDLPIDMDKIFHNKLLDAEQRLQRILLTPENTKINSARPDVKFNIKGAIQYKSGNAQAKPYKAMVDEDYEFNKKRVFILMDGSGSMSGLPEKNMLTFCTVVNRLANQNLFEGFLVGSKVSDDDKAISQGYKLPVKEGLITSFDCDAGGEGLGYALNLHMRDITKSDYIFVLTDGNINDMDLKFLKKRNKEAYDKTIGIYMGNSAFANREGLSEWFNKIICEKKFEDVIEKIVELLDPRANAINILKGLEVAESNVFKHTEPEEDFEISSPLR